MKTPPRSLSRSLSRSLAGSLRQWLARLQPTAAALPAVRKSRTEADVETEPPGACGWFDSSHELVHGLQVQELTSPESQAAALPLATWLQLQLEGSARPA